MKAHRHAWEPEDLNHACGTFQPACIAGANEAIDGRARMGTQSMKSAYCMIWRESCDGCFALSECGWPGSLAKGRNMFARMLLLVGAALLGMNLSAQPFVNSTAMTAKGYGVAEATIGSDAFGGTVGPAVDPTDPNAFYYYDGLSIRRYTLAEGTAQGEGVAFFAPPLPVGVANSKGGVYGTVMVFDPADPNSLWFAESSDRNVYVITIHPVNRASLVASRVAYTPNPGTNVYDIAFDTSGTGSIAYFTQGNFLTTEIVRITQSATAFTGATIGTVAGSSGPIDFDSFGNLYYIVPPFSGTPATAADQARLIRWTAATVAAAQGIGGIPLTEATSDATNVRTFTFASTPGVFPSISYILARTENGRPIIYAGNNDPQGVGGGTTGSIMRIDITQPSTNDEILWAPLVGGAVPGKIAAIRKTGGFGAGSGQWDEILGARNGRIYVALTFFDFVSSPATVAMIVPNNAANEIFSLTVTNQPAVEHLGVTFGSTVTLRDAGGDVITSGTASTLATTLTALTAPAAGNLTGTTTANAQRGVAQFSGLGVTATGAYAMQYTAGAISVQSSFTANRIAAINILSLAPQVTINTPFTATVELVDEGGSRITAGSGATANVILAIQTGPTGVTIPPAQGTVAAVNGVATFAGLTLPESGNYTLSFNAFIGALSQAAETAPLVVNNQVTFSTGGSGCSVAGVVGPGNGWPMTGAMVALLSIGGLLWLRRRTAHGRM